MKLTEIIALEAPLPDTWDAAIFSPSTPYSKRIKYARELSKRLGGGTSRVAFEIPFEGRRTVLKVAKNRKGVAQNLEEARKLSDSYIIRSELFIPMIDHDVDDGTWIHTEYATKAKRSDFLAEAGSDIQTIISYVESMARRSRYYHIDEFDAIDKESRLVTELMDYASSFPNEPLGDFGRLANWGKYNGRLVIIDAGFSQDIWDIFYKPGR